MLEFKFEIISKVRALLGLSIMKGDRTAKDGQTYVFTEVAIGLMLASLVITFYKLKEES